MFADVSVSETAYRLEFTENSVRKSKYPMSISFLGENTLLMAEVKGEWPDCLELMNRNLRLQFVWARQIWTIGDLQNVA